MTEEKILPMDGGEVPDDAQVRAWLVASYRDTPTPVAGAAAACAAAVLRRAPVERLALEQAAEAASGARRPAERAAGVGFAGRHWLIGAGLVAAALLITVTVRGRTPTLQNGASVAANTTVGSTTAFAGGIKFDLRLPRNFAVNVSVVGDFNDWDAGATPMVRDAASGEWSANVTLLPGRHVYAYLVDGEKWVVDPLAPQIPDAGYGPANAVVVEGEPR